MLNDKYIYDECESITEEEFDDVIGFGKKMLEYCKKKKLISLVANQVGCKKQMCVVTDDDGYDIYLNPELEDIPIEDEMISVSQECTPMPFDIMSFDKSKIMVGVVDAVKIHAYSFNKDDWISFTADGALGKVWQVVMYIMNGVNEGDLVKKDYLTIKSNKKKKPNDKCSSCGKKNKKCTCAVGVKQ